MQRQGTWENGEEDILRSECTKYDRVRTTGESDIE